jgi:hypothetical protein
MCTGGKYDVENETSICIKHCICSIIRQVRDCVVFQNSATSILMAVRQSNLIRDSMITEEEHYINESLKIILTIRELLSR